MKEFCNPFVMECREIIFLMQQSLTDLLKQGEGENLDFKQKITSLDKIAKTICSFANTSGGIILVGVKDNRSIVGIDPEEEKYMLEQAATTYCQPEIPLHFEEIEEDELVILKVTVDASVHKPHASLNKGGGWQVYIRQRDKSVPAGKNMVKHLQRELSEKSEMPVSAPDRNERKILEYLQIHDRITVKDLASLINFSSRRAQRLLTLMVNKGMLRLFEHEREDYYA